jgi:hypothetical protein
MAPGVLLKAVNVQTWIDEARQNLGGVVGGCIVDDVNVDVVQRLVQGTVDGETNRPGRVKRGEDDRYNWHALPAFCTVERVRYCIGVER